MINQMNFIKTPKIDYSYQGDSYGKINVVFSENSKTLDSMHDVAF